MFTVANSASEAIAAAADAAKVTRRSHMKRMRVSSGTRCSTPLGSAFGLVRRSHSATIQRVKTKAVKTVVTIPMASVTAKPRTGPVPR